MAVTGAQVNLSILETEEGGQGLIFRYVLTLCGSGPQQVVAAKIMVQQAKDALEKADVSTQDLYPVLFESFSQTFLERNRILLFLNDVSGPMICAIKRDISLVI